MTVEHLPAGPSADDVEQDDIELVSEAGNARPTGFRHASWHFAPLKRDLQNLGKFERVFDMRAVN